MSRCSEWNLRQIFRFLCPSPRGGRSSARLVCRTWAQAVQKIKVLIGGNEASIVHSLRTVASYEVVEFLPGTYFFEKCLVLNRPIKLRGSSSDQQRVTFVFLNNGTGVRVQSCVVIEDITFRDGRQPEDYPSPAKKYPNSASVLLARVQTYTEQTLNLVTVSPNARCKMLCCAIYGQLIQEENRKFLTRKEKNPGKMASARLKTVGVFVSSLSELKISNSVVAECFAGVYLQSANSARLRECVFRENAVGVHVCAWEEEYKNQPAQWVRIRDCRIRGLRGRGKSSQPVFCEADGEIEDELGTNIAASIGVSVHCDRVFVSGNVIGSATWGVCVGYAKPSIEDNMVERNLNGVMVGPVPAPASYSRVLSMNCRVNCFISRNIIRKNSSTDIVVEGEYIVPEVRNNILQHSPGGVIVRGEASAYFKHNYLLHHTLCSVYVNDDSSPIFEHNVISATTPSQPGKSRRSLVRCSGQGRLLLRHNQLAWVTNHSTKKEEEGEGERGGERVKLHPPGGKFSRGFPAMVMLNQRAEVVAIENGFFFVSDESSVPMTSCVRFKGDMCHVNAKGNAVFGPYLSNATMCKRGWKQKPQKFKNTSKSTISISSTHWVTLSRLRKLFYNGQKDLPHGCLDFAPCSIRASDLAQEGATVFVLGNEWEQGNQADWRCWVGEVVKWDPDRVIRVALEKCGRWRERRREIIKYCSTSMFQKAAKQSPKTFSLVVATAATVGTLLGVCMTSWLSNEQTDRSRVWKPEGPIMGADFPILSTPWPHLTKPR